MRKLRRGRGLPDHARTMWTLSPRDRIDPGDQTPWGLVADEERLEVESVAAQVDRTGLHPIADGRTRRARHALPWNRFAVWSDADLALAGEVPTGRHVDRSYLTSMSLLAREVEAAVWTEKAVQR